jgi:hypothetical protein
MPTYVMKQLIRYLATYLIAYVTNYLLIYPFAYLHTYPSNKNGGVTVTQANVFIIPLTTSFGQDFF